MRQLGLNEPVFYRILVICLTVVLELAVNVH